MTSDLHRELFVTDAALPAKPVADMRRFWRILLASIAHAAPRVTERLER